MADNRTNKPTPNPTAEQIALRALHPEATRNLPLASIYAKRICHDLRAHGLLSEGAPTEAQVEAAVHAAWVKSREFRGVGGQAEFAPPWEFQQVIRAALVAAQGAAPVLPSSG